MSTASEGRDAWQVDAPTGDADPLDLDSRQTLKDRARPQAVGSAGRIAESQRADAEGLASIDPLVADQALTASERRRGRVARPQYEGRLTPEGVLADAQALKVIDSRHEGLQAVPAGALGAVAAREAVTSDGRGDEQLH